MSVAVAFAPDGATIASGCYSGKVTLWSAAGEKQWERDGGRAVCSVAFAPDGATIASGYRGKVTLWSAILAEREAQMQCGAIVCLRPHAYRRRAVPS